MHGCTNVELTGPVCMHRSMNLLEAAVDHDHHLGDDWSLKVNGWGTIREEGI